MRGHASKISPDNWPRPGSKPPISKASMTRRQREIFSPKLPAAAVKEIRRLARQARKLAKAEGRKVFPGFTRRLAQAHGVSQRCIQMIIQGKRQTGKPAGRPRRNSR